MTVGGAARVRGVPAKTVGARPGTVGKRPRPWGCDQVPGVRPWPWRCSQGPWGSGQGSDSVFFMNSIMWVVILFIN